MRPFWWWWWWWWLPEIIVHENPFSSSRVVPCNQPSEFNWCSKRAHEETFGVVLHVPHTKFCLLEWLGPTPWSPLLESSLKQLFSYMRLELLTAVNTKTGPSGLWQRHVVWCGRSVEYMFRIFSYLEDRGSWLLWNTGNHLPHYMAVLHPRRLRLIRFPCLSVSNRVP
jgi:hypothetical protein